MFQSNRGECEDILVEESSKLQFVLELVKSFVKEGHRALIFSQSRKMLDIVDKVLSKQVGRLSSFVNLSCSLILKSFRHAFM